MLSVHLVQLTVTSLRTQTDFIATYEEEARRYYTNIVGKYGPQVQNAIRKVSGLDIKRIAPLHGPIWRTPKQFNTSCTNTCTGPTIQLRKKALLSPSDLCMVTLVPSHNNWLNNYPNVVLQISKSTMFPN